MGRGGEEDGGKTSPSCCLLAPVKARGGQCRGGSPTRDLVCCGSARPGAPQRGAALAAPRRQPAPNLRLPHAARSHLLKLSQPCQGEAGNVTMHLASWQGEDCLWSCASAVHLLNIVHERKKKSRSRHNPGLQSARGQRDHAPQRLGAPRPGSSPRDWGQSRAAAAQPPGSIPSQLLAKLLP